MEVGVRAREDTCLTSRPEVCRGQENDRHHGVGRGVQRVSRAVPGTHRVQKKHEWGDKDADQNGKRKLSRYN